MSSISSANFRSAVIEAPVISGVDEFFRLVNGSFKEPGSAPDVASPLGTTTIWNCVTLPVQNFTDFSLDYKRLAYVVTRVALTIFVLPAYGLLGALYNAGAGCVKGYYAGKIWMAHRSGMNEAQYNEFKAITDATAKHFTRSAYDLTAVIVKNFSILNTLLWITYGASPQTVNSIHDKFTKERIERVEVASVNDQNSPVSPASQSFIEIEQKGNDVKEMVDKRIPCLLDQYAKEMSDYVLSTVKKV